MNNTEYKLNSMIMSVLAYTTLAEQHNIHAIVALAIGDKAKYKLHSSVKSCYLAFANAYKEAAKDQLDTLLSAM
jgi:hypothetical protein